jgi:hypothetical protein
MNLGLSLALTRLGRPASPFDPDAFAYITAVEAADGQALEAGVRVAIDEFVRGCKADGIWAAIKASCILAGARTLTGALVPLVGSAPTNFNFVGSDYNRKTGLKGDGSTKYLNTNRAGNADPQDNIHLSAFVTVIHDPALTTPVSGGGGSYIGNGGATTGATHFGRAGGTPPSFGSTFARNRNSSVNLNIDPIPPSPGFYGIARALAASYSLRSGGANYTVVQNSQTPAVENHFVLARNNGSGSPEVASNGRIAFYSIGENLNLSQLDARVSTLMTALEFGINTGLPASDYDADTVAYVNRGYAAGGSLS